MDCRDSENICGKWYESFDQTRMTFTIIEYGEENSEGELEEKEIELPAMWELCGLCQGRGSHVNPSIDSCGISNEDFAEDPDFRESYFSGAYDVPCYRCSGRTTEPVVNEEGLSEEVKKLYHETIQNHYDDIREREAEIKYGY
jgi:hypothetical protein